MAAFREQNSSTSPNTLDHFRKKDPDNTLVTCKHCSDAVVFRNSLKNLRKHLVLKHSDILEHNDDISEDDDSISSRNPKYVRSKVWNYFNIHDEIGKLAECTQCSQLLSYKTTSTNLTKHLKRIHGVEFFKAEPSDNEVEETAELDPEDMPVEKLDSEDENVEHDIQLIVNGDSRSRHKSSMAWEHFTVKDERRKLATCKLCGAVCSYRASVSNLMKHARRKHGAANLGFDGSDGRPLGSSGGRALIWLYFKMLDRSSRLCQCLICHKLFRYSANNDSLKKHLLKRHPNVNISGMEDGNKRILLSSGGDLYEVETTDKDCDENDNDHHQHQVNESATYGNETPRKRVKANNVTDLTNDTSSEDEVTLLRKPCVKKTLGSFDYFGKYIAALLKQLPRTVANNLQVDFVKQLMSAQGAAQVLQDQKTEEAKKSTQNTKLSYFEVNGDKVSCRLCHKTLDNDDDKMTQHLRDVHYAKSSDHDSDNEVYSEVVYLEDEDPVQIKSEEQMVQPFKRKRRVKRSRNTFEEEAGWNYGLESRNQLVKIKRELRNDSVTMQNVSGHSYGEKRREIQYEEKKEDEVDKFGTYITSLLRTLPKTACLKIQLEIVNLVMKEKLKHCKSDTDDVANNSYVLTVTNQGNVNIDMQNPAPSDNDNLTVSQCNETLPGRVTVTNAGDTSENNIQVEIEGQNTKG